MTQQATRLAATISALFRNSWVDGKQRACTLSHGLQVTVSTYPDELIALSRKAGVPSMDEAAIVARDAGWNWFSTEWQTHQGIPYLIIRPEYPPDDEDENAPDPLPSPAPEGQSEAIRALLLSPGPWQQEALSLRGTNEQRQKIVSGFKSCQLDDWLRWVRGKFPTEFNAYLARTPRSTLRNQS